MRGYGLCSIEEEGVRSYGTTRATKQTLKDDVIDQLMAIGVYKIKDLQLYQVPLHILVQEYRKHVS